MFFFEMSSWDVSLVVELEIVDRILVFWSFLPPGLVRLVILLFLLLLYRGGPVRLVRFVRFVMWG